MTLNNVNVKRLANEAKGLRSAPTTAVRVNRIEATWNTDPSRPQMQATVKYEQGQVVWECDSPTFMGGEGRRPGPLHYCVMGFAACFTATYATAAAARNVALKKLSVLAECELDFSKVFGVTEDPIMRNATFTISVQADASRAQLEELKNEALSRCPGVFLLQHAIPVAARLA